MADMHETNDALENQGNSQIPAEPAPGYADGGYAPAPADSYAAGAPAPEYGGSYTLDPYAADVTAEPVMELPAIDTEGESDFLSAEARDFDISKSAGKDDADAVNPTLDEVSKSFGALKDSIEQGRELKARERERDALLEQIGAGREELADRDNILANYAAISADQDALIYQHGQQRDDLRAQISDATARQQATQQQLDDLRAYHAQQLAPLENELGRATAAADQAKSDERSRKSEQNAAESELAKAAEDKVNIAQAKLDQITAAYNEAKTRTERAKDQLGQAQKAYDNAKRQFDSEESPVERAIADLGAQIEDLKGQVSELDATIDKLTARRQYVEDVYRNPQDTEDLRNDVADSEATERKMSEEAEDLRNRLAESKERSKKAKMTIGIIAAVVVLVVVVVVFALTR